MKKTNYKYLIVDGYNLINALHFLKKASESSLENGRLKLNNLLSEYAFYYKERVIVVYDAYMSNKRTRSIEEYKGIEVVYTKINETADSYIEITVEALMNNKRNMVRVVTSDWAEQQIILGSGGIRTSPREFNDLIKGMNKEIKDEYVNDVSPVNSLENRLDPSTLSKLDKIRKS